MTIISNSIFICYKSLHVILNPTDLRKFRVVINLLVKIMPSYSYLVWMEMEKERN